VTTPNDGGPPAWDDLLRNQTYGVPLPPEEPLDEGEAPPE
jgi:hypothetical protein